MQIDAHFCWKNPLRRADSLEQLVAWNDVNFVRCAYVTVLGRQPDPEGETLYTEKLRAGSSKLKIIKALRDSPEGRGHDPGIAGLDRQLRQYERSTMPGIGWFFQWTKGARLESSSAQIRRLEVAAEVSREAFIREFQALRAVVANISQLNATTRNVEQIAERGLSQSGAALEILTSFVAEFRAFREEQVARNSEQAARIEDHAGRNAEQRASFVKEFRAFRDEQVARNYEQAARIEDHAGRNAEQRASFVEEFRAFRDEQAARIEDHAGRNAEQRASFVKEFRAFRDEQAARGREQIARDRANAEHVYSTLVSFVGEFRAFREEDAGRSRGILDSVRGLKASMANEFDALRSEQSMRASEVRDLINVDLGGSFAAALAAPSKKANDADPAFATLGPASARIVSQLKSNRPV